jgi:hypothetical protein
MPLRRTVKFLSYALIALLVGTVGLLFFAIEDKPLVDRTPEFRSEHIERAKRILTNNDPRRLKPGQVRTISVSEEDLDLTALYLVSRYLNGSSRVAIKLGNAEVAVSFPFALGSARRYINVNALMAADGPVPRFEHLRIGRLPIPARLANAALYYGIAQLRKEHDFKLVMDSILHFALTPGRLQMTYVWHADLVEPLRKTAVSSEDEERLRAYQERLVQATTHGDAKGPVSLAPLMRSLLQLARERTEHGEPVAENRAWILVLTLSATGNGLERIVPEAKHWPRPALRMVTLHGRDDTAKHFMVSAALSAYAGEPLADAIEVYKELEDSRSGSGFSFDDIASDRAGSRFGELAAASATSAKRLQEKLSGELRESDLVPPIDDLPSFMPEAEFERRFGGVGGSGYMQMMDEIERRVAALRFNS